MTVTIKQLYEGAKKAKKDNVCKFMRDMKRVKLKLIYYQGRFHWFGPAVVVPNIQDCLSNTKVPCQWDCMGLAYVVYPKECFKPPYLNE